LLFASAWSRYPSDSIKPRSGWQDPPMWCETTHMAQTACAMSPDAK